MAFQPAVIYFNDSSSKFNRDLTDFLERNIKTAIVRGKLRFQFKIANENDLARLKKMSVKKLPAMIISKNAYVGVPDIVDAIRLHVKTSKSSAAPKTDDENVHEFMMAALDAKTDVKGKFLKDQGDTDEQQPGDDLMSKYNREVERRGLVSATPIDRDDDDDNRPAPKKPSRTFVQDHIDTDIDEQETPQQPPRAPTKQQRGRARPDNIGTEGMDDVMASMQNIRKTARSAEDAKDDDMMAQLIAKMSGD